MNDFEGWMRFRRGENPSPTPRTLACAYCDRHTPVADSHAPADRSNLFGDLTCDETGEALTVCKSCGPEFDHDATIGPDAPQPQQTC